MLNKLLQKRDQLKYEIGAIEDIKNMEEFDKYCVINDKLIRLNELIRKVMESNK